MNLKWMSPLRALGVVLVLIYHFFPAALPGGFIGVDIFFVFSGYLICSLLVFELENKGWVSLRRFYTKRIRRLLPAALFLVLVTLALSLLISPDFRVNIDKQTAAVLGWCTNFYEISTGQSYENVLLPHLFVHTWTLAVEMHFYLIWGAIVFGGILLARRVVYGPHMRSRHLSHRHAEARERRLRPVLVRRVKLVLVVALAVLILGSYINMQVFMAAFEEPAVAYYSTSSHIYPLLIGSAAGLLAGFNETSLTKRLQKLPVAAGVAVCVAALVLVVVLAFTLHYSGPETYSFGILLVSVLVALVLVLVRAMQTRITRPEPKIVSYVADRSYSIYLFHWPLYIVIEQLLTTNAVVSADTLAGNLIIGGLAIVATIAFAEISYSFVEKRFRIKGGNKGDNRNVPLSPLKAVIGTSLSVIVCLALSGCSVYALATEPKSSTIQQEFEHELLLNSIDLMATMDTALQTYNLNPVANPGSLDVLYADEGLELEHQRDIASKARQQAAQEAMDIYGSIDSNYGTVTVIGDSVVLGATSVIKDALGGGFVDAEGSRRMDQVFDYLQQLDEMGLLGEYVVIGLGTNVIEPLASEGARTIADNIGPGHRLIFVTGYGHDGTLPLNDTLRSLASEYPYVTVADWYNAILPHPELLTGDHIHIASNEGAKAIYAQTIIGAIETASAKPSS